MSQEVLDEAWWDSAPGTKCCRNLDLNNIYRWFGEKPRTTITDA